MLTVRAVETAELETGEALLERLDLPEEALENLARLGGVDEASLRVGGGWAARVELDGAALIVLADGDRWAIRGGDEAMFAARKLHGLIGAQADGWDLDR
jgi:hypothetical protein